MTPMRSSRGYFRVERGRKNGWGRGKPRRKRSVASFSYLLVLCLFFVGAVSAFFITLLSFTSACERKLRFCRLCDSGISRFFFVFSFLRLRRPSYFSWFFRSERLILPAFFPAASYCLRSFIFPRACKLWECTYFLLRHSRHTLRLSLHPQFVRACVRACSCVV